MAHILAGYIERIVRAWFFRAPQMPIRKLFYDGTKEVISILDSFA